MKCPQCGKTTPFVCGSFCSYCGALITSQERSSSPYSSLQPPTLDVLESKTIPWESEQRKSTPFLALYATFCESLFHPNSFFKLAVNRKQDSIAPALWYGLITGSIGIITTWMWCEIYAKFGQSFTDYTSLFGNTFVSPSMLIATPLLILLQMMSIALYTSFMMHFSKCQNASIGQIVRILCYAESTSVIQMIPVVGSFASIILWVYSVLTGFHHLYGVSRMKVVVALVLPLIIMSVLLTIIVVAGVVGGVIAGAGFLQNWQALLK
jgi:hypothetical protein